MTAPARCACGYFDTDHGPAGKCPLCSCGEVPAEHRPVMTPPSPLFHVTIKAHVEYRCPGKGRSEKTGKFPTLRLGTLRSPAPDPARRDWFGMLTPVIARVVDDPEHVPVPPPRVRGRAPAGPLELAPRAVRMGRLATAAGWRAVPVYSVAGDGTEACSLRMHHEDLALVALWKRPAAEVGKLTGWASDGAYAWRRGERPKPCTHSDVEVVFRDQ